MNERELIRACQRGEKQAFDELIRAFYPYVTKFLLKTCGNETLTEDLCQETFLKMIRNIEKYDVNGKAGFGTYIITIAKNTYVDYLRKNRHPEDNIDELVIPDDYNLENDVLTQLKYHEAMAVIEKLPPEQGMAITLKYLESQTLEEIAERFGVPSKTIKSRIHDGTVKLRKMLLGKASERMDGS